jgi:sialic acid synthase SpsE/quercetin dioxygenase-like cupin family protein
MFYIFEMANNHQGSVEHAKLIVDEFSKLALKKGINAGIKLQFRQLDTFIHNNFKNSDLKFVKRFNDTRLSKNQFNEIVDYIRVSGLATVATPFDNESLGWLSDMQVSVIKIASCSIDDWPLLREVSKINKKIIISTGGASYKVLQKVYNLFKHNNRDFLFLHCVGEYPTPHGSSNLKRIRRMRELFPDVEIGISTHEDPNKETIVPLAVAMGCSVVEKHVGVKTDKISLNAYSNTSSQMATVIDKVNWALECLRGESVNEKESLRKLKRGIYAKENIPKGKILSQDDFYFAMPLQKGQLNVSDIDKLLGAPSPCSFSIDSPVNESAVELKINNEKINSVKDSVRGVLESSTIALSGLEKAEISCHYGLDKFNNYGAFIIDKINREYCKKLIVMQPGQSHPTHHHLLKEEAFELLHGDCLLVLEDKEINMRPGRPIVIARGIKHSFSSIEGCIIEEISTTHVPGDSIYDDPKINSLKLEERKIKVKL